MSTNPHASPLAVAVFEAFARNGGNSPADHFDRNAAEQWMQQALDECMPKPAAAPADLHTHLLHMLGAKDHEDAGRIIGELHAASMSTPAAPGVDLEQFRDAVIFWKDSALRDMQYHNGPMHEQANEADRLLALIDASPKGGIHPDDAAVDAFAAEMKAKLAKAREKGRGGWQGDEPGMQQRLSDMLREHVEKGDPRDVANFCMFLHQRGEGISPKGRSDAMAWHAPDNLPDVPPGDMGWFWVAVKRANGKTYSFPASYLNGMLLSDEDGSHDEPMSGNRYSYGAADEDEGSFQATGWHSAQEHSEYDNVYMPLLSDDDELIAWRAVEDFTLQATSAEVGS